MKFKVGDLRNLQGFLLIIILHLISSCKRSLLKPLLQFEQRIFEKTIFEHDSQLRISKLNFFHALRVVFNL